MSTRQEQSASIAACQRNVNSTCNDDRGRRWTFMDMDGPLTCEDTPSTQSRTIGVEAGLGFDAALAQVARNTVGPTAQFQVALSMGCNNPSFCLVAAQDAGR
jgi:hypothetical protein